jgi:5,6-dimethylbenzimidazole synthase
MAADLSSSSSHAFEPRDAQAVYRAIFERRDMRHFAGGEVPPAQLLRLLDAAHHAPSVGFMQPWRFIRVTDLALRRRLHEVVEQERLATARALGEREDEFMRLKVQGLLDAAEVLVVALADGRERHIFGRRTMPQMDLASAACAIQNLWLAARAEGLGMGGAGGPAQSAAGRRADRAAVPGTGARVLSRADAAAAALGRARSAAGDGVRQPLGPRQRVVPVR